MFDVSGGGTREFVTNTNKYTKSYVGLPLQEDCVKNGGFQYHLGATIFSELCYFTGQVMLKLVLKQFGLIVSFTRAAVTNHVANTEMFAA